MKYTSKTMYALICDDSKYWPKEKRKTLEPLLCGVYGSRKEAHAASAEVKDCLCKHYVKRVKVTCETY